MRDTLKLKESVGSRLLWVIEDSETPDQVMDAMEEAANNRGLLPSGIRLRRDNPVNFVRDLWWDNPEIQERVNLNADQLHPLKINDLFSALDAIQ